MSQLRKGSGLGEGDGAIANLNSLSRRTCLHSSKECPFATTLPSIFLNSSLKDRSPVSVNPCLAYCWHAPEGNLASENTQIPIAALLKPITKVVGHIWKGGEGMSSCAQHDMARCSQSFESCVVIVPSQSDRTTNFASLWIGG